MYHQAALALVREIGPLPAFRRLIAENDALILKGMIDRGREIAAMRTAAYTAVVADWAEKQQLEQGYTRRFALVAVGGTGREEIVPGSDVDLVFLCDDEIDGNTFLLELQRQTLHTMEFDESHGFPISLRPYNLDDAARLRGKDITSFLDMRMVFGSNGLVTDFRERIRATFDRFEQFLQMLKLWKDQLALLAACDRMVGLNLKDLLRIFQAGVWTLAGKDFEHSHDIYKKQVDRAVCDSYFELLFIRAMVNLRRQPGGREDVLTLETSASLGEMVAPDADEEAQFRAGNMVREWIFSARCQVLSFAHDVILRELREGRRVSSESPITYGTGGLYHAARRRVLHPSTRDRAALNLLLEARRAPSQSQAAFLLLHASQRHGLPIDESELPNTFRTWKALLPVPEVAALFYESHGSLADSFAFLNQIDRAQECIFPGHASSFDQCVLSEPCEVRKLRALENCLAHASKEPVASNDVETLAAQAVAFLDVDHLAAVKLALKTKHLPLTPEDEAARSDATRPPHERFASGFSEIRLEDYYKRIGPECGFSTETISATEFLVANSRAFTLRADEGQNDRRQVESFCELCGTEQKLLALFTFTFADRFAQEHERRQSARWFNIRELYLKSRRAFRGQPVAAATELHNAGFAPEDQRILADFGEDYFGGLYHRHVNRFGSDLVRLAHAGEDDAAPKAALLHDGAALILGVAARDFRGLAACVSGALCKERVGIGQAHFFSAMNHGLALDFFHLAPGAHPLPASLPRVVEEAVRAQFHIAEKDEADLPRLGDSMDLQESSPGHFRLRCDSEQETGLLIYALCVKLFRQLEADIHGLSANNSTRSGGTSFVTIHHTLPATLSLEEARRIVRERC